MQFMCMLMYTVPVNFDDHLSQWFFYVSIIYTEDSKTMKWHIR